MASSMNPKAAWGSWIAAATLLFIVALFAWPLPMAMAFLSDDAFYYLEIGRSIASGAGSTFDGIAATNGYHPLWMLIVSGLMSVTGGEALFSASVVMAASVVFCGVGIYLAVMIVRRFIDVNLAPLAVAFMLSPFAFSAMTNGLETALAMFAVLLVIYCCYRYGALGADAGLVQCVLLGALLGVVFLSRLDMAFLPLAAGVLVIAESIRSRARFASLINRAVAMFAPFALVTTPYFLWNRAEFGSFAPISGSVKSSFPQIRESLHLEGDSEIGLAILILLTLCTLVAVRRRADVESKPALASPLTLVTLASWLHFVYAYLYMDWGVYWWHFTLSSVSLAIAAPAALASVGISTHRIAIGAAVALCIAFVPLQLQVNANRYDRHVVWLEAAEWAKANTRDDAVFAIKDAGLFRYFSGRSVVNLDGKANGASYWQSVVTGTVHDYLRSVGVQYIGELNAGCMGESCFIRIHVPRVPDVFLELKDEDLLYIGRPYPKRIGSSAQVDTRFRIWRYPSS